MCNVDSARICLLLKLNIEIDVTFYWHVIVISTPSTRLFCYITGSIHLLMHTSITKIIQVDEKLEKNTLLINSKEKW